MRIRGRPRLLAGVDELDAVALILERAREVEALPPAVLALILVGGRADLRVARVKDAVVVGVGHGGRAEGREVNDAVRVNHLVARPTWVARRGRAGRAAPPVPLGVQGARVPPCNDFKPGGRIAGDVVVVNGDVGVRRAEVVLDDYPFAGVVLDHVAVDGEPAITAEEADGVVPRRGRIGDEVRRDGGVLGGEEIHAARVGIEGVVLNADVRIRVGRVGVTEPDTPRVAYELVSVYQDVRHEAAGDELIRVDAVAARRAGPGVVAEQVVLNKRLVAGRTVGQKQAGDVVLDDVVDDVRARRSRAEHDARAENVVNRRV